MKKTGELIGAVRREKGLTQRELAQALHISDRTVSKWERGVGFPDVSLLEPLAAALELTVLDLLRGEPSQEQDVEQALKEAMEAFHQQRRRERRELWRLLGQAVLFVLPVVAFWLAVNPPTEEIDHTITAGVYRNGVLVDYTPVEIQGEVSRNVFTGEEEYWGRFAIGCVEWTGREEAKAGLDLQAGSYSGVIYVPTPGLLRNDLYDISTICSQDMGNFAFTMEGENTEDWLILATSPQMYEDYAALRGGVPPLAVPKGEWVPEFPVPWAATEHGPQ